MTLRLRDVGPAALATGLFGLLVALAALQYRWLGQLGAAELERLRAGSRASTAQLASEFDREITRAFLWLRPEPRLGQADDEWTARYAERHARWMRDAPHPRIVRDVFLTEATHGRPPRIRRFDPQRRAFEPAPLPAALASLATMPEPATPGLGARVSFEPVSEEGPALVHRVATFVTGPVPSPPATATHQIVIWLDRDVLVGELLPWLVRRHLPATELLEPRVEVVSAAAPGHVVFTSDPDAPRPPGVSAASVDLFAVRLGEANRDLLAGAAPRDMFQHVNAPRGRTRGGTFTVSMAGTPAAFVAGLPARPPGVWRLTLSHRGGSLDELVASSRRRNVLLSSGILLVLAAGVLMTVIAAHRARRLARAEREFVAGVSHELSTPLSVIGVAGENLADGLVTGDAAVRRYGALVRDEGRRLRALVDQVLEFAGPEGAPLRREPVDLRAVVAGALAAWRLEIERGGFDVRAELPPSLPPVEGDAALLQGAVQNLLGNAIKYSGESRRVDVHVEVPAGGREVWITVEDLGFGVHADEQRLIFEPFYRGLEAHRRQIRGSGLGLALVRRTVEQHGGGVSVRSTPGAGSAFTIRLPMAPVARPGHRTEEVHAKADPAR